MKHQQVMSLHANKYLNVWGNSQASNNVLDISGGPNCVHTAFAHFTSSPQIKLSGILACTRKKYVLTVVRLIATPWFNGSNLINQSLLRDCVPNPIHFYLGLFYWVKLSYYICPKASMCCYLYLPCTSDHIHDLSPPHRAWCSWSLALICQGVVVKSASMISYESCAPVAFTALWQPMKLVRLIHTLLYDAANKDCINR